MSKCERKPIGVAKKSNDAYHFKKSNDAAILFLSIIFALVMVGVSFLSSSLNYFLNKIFIDAVDPSSIQWYHWFFWSDEIVDAALYAFYPATWWTITLVMGGIVFVGSMLVLHVV